MRQLVRVTVSKEVKWLVIKTGRELEETVIGVVILPSLSVDLPPQEKRKTNLPLMALDNRTIRRHSIM